MKKNISRRQTIHDSHITSEKIPEYLKNDFDVAFTLFDPSKQEVSFAQAKSILWNFGFWKLSEGQFDEILKEQKLDQSKNIISYKELLAIVSKKYASDGRLLMTKSIFSIFDDGSGCTNIDLIFERLSQNLEISVSESEVKNIFEEVNDSSQITLDDFLSLLT